MPTTPTISVQEAAFRIDTFIVPPAAMSPFITQLQRVQRKLYTLPGCQQNLVLTQTAGTGEFNVLTLVEWASADAMAAAKSSMQAHYAQEGFDPAAFMKDLGVRADFAVYADVPAFA